VSIKKIFSLTSVFLNLVLLVALVGLTKDRSKNYGPSFKPSLQSETEKSSENLQEKVMGERVEAVYKVVKVVDGDTIVLEGGTTLRYIGIDTPEVSQGKECFAEDATKKNQELVEGKNVRLEKDVSEADRYGRLLRYVWVDLPSQGAPAQGIFVNESLVREGYATAATYPPDVKYSELFREAERQARENNRGLWGECDKEGSKVPPFDSPQGKPFDKSPGKQEPVVLQYGDWECSANTYNCSDFNSQAEAQSAFEACGGTSNDVHRLDSDKDGKVCESLP